MRPGTSVLLVGAVLAAFVAGPLTAQSVDVVAPHAPATLQATSLRTPHGEASPLPVTAFTVSRGIGIVQDDGRSVFPGLQSNVHGQGTWRATPTANNTFVLKKVAYQFDDPSAGVVLYDGAKRPIVGFLDANYLFPSFALATPFPFGGKQYTKLNISTWGAIAFGDADTTQLNYDPTVVSSMFRIPMVAVWYELYYYPYTARIIARNKPGSVVITWQNVLSRHSQVPCTFQAELFYDTGEIQLSYQSLSPLDGLVGFSTGTESVVRQNASVAANPDIPLHLQASSASFDNYGGIIAGVTLKLQAAVPVPAAGESFRYTLVLNGVDVIGLEYNSSLSPFVVVANPKIPAFPDAQIKSWETKLSGDTLSFRFPGTSLEPYRSGTGNDSWTIKSTRFGGAGFVERTITQAQPLNFTLRQSLLPSVQDTSVEVPAEVFHYTPDVWDTDRIRESIAAYLVSRGQNVDSFRFFPTGYDDGLKHSNYAGTYPRQKSVTGVGQIPARTDCDCHYGAEFSSVDESLASEATTQVALTHELGHECLFYADYKDTDGVVKGPWRDAGVPCFGGAHPNNGLANPSMFADSESPFTTISVMGGSPNGVYQLNAPRFGFSRVEMYLLGLASASEVTPITFVQIGGTSQINIDQITSANGVRTPAYVAGQTKVFRVPAFVVKRQGETVSDATLQQLQNLLFRWQSRFWRETAGRARANTTLDGGCSYTLSSSGTKVIAGGASGSVSLFAEQGCTFSASASDAWISVTTNPGAGTVSYVVSANASVNPLTGTISIAGQPFTVTQYGTGRHRSAGR